MNAAFGAGLKLFMGKAGLTLAKHSPEILLVTGITGMVGATFLACCATLKCETVIDAHKEKVAMCHEAKENYPAEDYSERDFGKDLFTVRVQTGLEFVKLYGPALTLGVAGIACILGSYNILNKRNVALIAAYKLVEQSFTNYRNRVKDELGADKDFHFMHGTEYEEVTEEIADPQTGKTKKVKTQRQVLNGTDCSMYARLYDKQQWNADMTSYTGSSQWSPNAQYNATTLVLKNQWANDHLNANGFVFLNDVYDELGFPRTQAGQMVGWRLRSGGGDNYISFGSEVDAIINKTAGYLAYTDGSPILLDFNVEGIVLDAID